MLCSSESRSCARYRQPAQPRESIRSARGMRAARAPVETAIRLGYAAAMRARARAARNRWRY
jgi:hypothetical protein